MVIIAFCSALVGAALSTKFRVIVLIPITLIGFAFIALVTILTESTLASAIVSGVVLATFLQLGYLGGRIIRLA